MAGTRVRRCIRLHCPCDPCPLMLFRKARSLFSSRRLSPMVVRSPRLSPRCERGRAQAARHGMLVCGCVTRCDASRRASWALIDTCSTAAPLSTRRPCTHAHLFSLNSLSIGAPTKMTCGCSTGLRWAWACMDHYLWACGTLADHGQSCLAQPTGA
jgi:hypothetical protein